MLNDININDFNYPLAEDRIAKFPLKNRKDSKLLVYKNGDVTDRKFIDITQEISPKSQIIFNNTRVVQARLLFFRPNAVQPIEIFCLEPLSSDVQIAMATKREIEFYCLVGRAKKWKEGPLSIMLKDHQLQAEKGERRGQGCVIKFSWDGDITFAEILEEAGHTPLPPYLKRADEESDKDRYQTVYAEINGSVAAPTAGLHFTPTIIEELKSLGHSIGYTTLHVGAGTFKPVSTEKVADHEMHFEEIHVSSAFIQSLINHRGSRTAVGTTSVRTLESLYWLGVKLLQDPNTNNIELNQWDAYQLPKNVEVDQALTMLLHHMNDKDLFSRTQLMIGPGYTFRMVNSIVTNFHQPKSTLLLLVAAATQGDWKTIYDYALANNYRFLSYGDSSIIHI
ncbi:MAG: S-adenosylmethionine:tRNA ribosyltransferase-isomerase [Schleiferiaceae bacterium]|nr:S-adenosylmethionine:tRNA ribosyltransferase-isomerase [Schleiferiaceae bacterium]